MDQPTSTSNRPSMFYLACRNGEYDSVVNFLAQYSLEDIDKMEPNGSTALHAACYYKNKDIVRLLLDRGFARRVINKYDKKPIDEADTEELRQLFLRPLTSNRFGGLTSYDNEKLIWIPINENNKNAIPDPIEDLYKGNRLKYGLFQINDIIKQCKDMPKLDTIQRFLRRAISERDCTHLIQAYTAETNFYNLVNSYLLSRDQGNSLEQFVQTIYFNKQLHSEYSYEDLCYRAVVVDSLAYLDLFNMGTKLRNRTFISTTRDRQIAETYAADRKNASKYIIMMIFKIRYPNVALGVEEMSEFSHEEEVLIMYDKIFTVTDIRKKEDFYFEIELHDSKLNRKN